MYFITSYGRDDGINRKTNPNAGASTATMFGWTTIFRFGGGQL